MTSFDFVNRSNADYIEDLYRKFQQDPRSVEPQWRAFFAGFDAGIARGIKGPAAGPIELTNEQLPEELSLQVADLVHSYRELGHFVARLDPLGHDRPDHPLLELTHFDLSESDLDRKVTSGGFLGPTAGTLRDLIEKLKTTYCSTLGVEYLSISDKAQRQFLQERMEPILNRPDCETINCRSILQQVTAAQSFEEFLGLKYVTQKRFSLEGGEALIPLLNTLVEAGADAGGEQFIMGMAHRGRLNVLANVVHKPLEIILGEFEGTALPQEHQGDGDVKYHLGYSVDRKTASGKLVHVALSFNPSHLELVHPVVEGIVRAKQYYMGDDQRTRVVPILIHGDAAFCGQGIVQETIALSEMPYWRTGGTIHVIVNNQIGFTTMPKQGRFTPYPTDVAKMIQAPIFHVNGDDPEAVVHAARLAVEFRQRFHADVFIDLWCYRRHGHNEVDEPSFTQPEMYRQIAAHARPREIYSNRLIADGRISATDFDQLMADERRKLDEAWTAARAMRGPRPVDAFGGVWKAMTRDGTPEGTLPTAVPAQTIDLIGRQAARLPEGFTINPKLKRLVASREQMCRGEIPIDWGCAEMVAMGSLVLEGTPVRFVGQDTQRGTFSHRHACLHDFNTGQKYFPLSNLDPKQAPIIIVNTMLSELAVVGFEYGFSTADPRNLVVWEAQFGDFINGAQAVIDQFVAAAESKWRKYSGLVMLLPHGYEGQGSEHSNAYLERFLSLCAEGNMQVCNPTLPAQYFHLLRRQIKRDVRKPLICMMPKSLLRYEKSTSTLDELTRGSFHAVLDDPSSVGERVRRVLLCCGKVFFALDAARQKADVPDVAIIRVEQLYPFPQKEIQAILSRHSAVREFCWVQEEPRNRGAWTFMRERLEPLLPETAVLRYIGRDEAASPATGSFRAHQAEEEELLAAALELSVEQARLQKPASPKEAAARGTPVSD